MRTTALYLTGKGFDEAKTGDGYGYRFTRGKTAIDVMLPEGLDRQDRYPTTASGRPGLSADGGNQALTRAERLPVNIGGRVGHVRRPTLLGAHLYRVHVYFLICVANKLCPKGTWPPAARIVILRVGR